MLVHGWRKLKYEFRNVRSELWTICQDIYDALSKVEGQEVSYRTPQLFDDSKAVIVLGKAAEAMKVSKVKEIDDRVFEFSIGHGELVSCSLA